MLSKCCGRSASAPTELAGNPPHPRGLGTADRGGSRAPAPPGQGRSPGSEGESSGRPAGARAPHLKVVRVREAQGPESFEVGGTWVAAGLRRFPAVRPRVAEPVRLRLSCSTICKVGSGGLTSPGSWQRPRSIWAEPGDLP